MDILSDDELLLAGLDTEARARLNGWIESHSYQGVAIHAAPTWSDRKFWQRRGPEFELGRLASKYGGLPYFEAVTDIPKHHARRYEPLAQFDFAALPEVARPMPRSGILVLWVIREAWTAMPFEVRFYPNPTAGRAGPTPDDLKLDRRREARLTFEARRLISEPTVAECEEILADQAFDPSITHQPSVILREHLAGMCYSDDDSGNTFLPEDEAWIRSRLGDEALEGRCVLLRLGDDWGANLEIGSSSLYVTTNAEALERGELRDLACHWA